MPYPVAAARGKGGAGVSALPCYYLTFGATPTPDDYISLAGLALTNWGIMYREIGQ